MKLRQDHTTDTIEVTLSETNLRTLLAKLQREDSARTIYKHIRSTGALGGYRTLVVKAEPDDTHYNGEQRGLMHPIEENTLREQHPA